MESSANTSRKKRLFRICGIVAIVATSGLVLWALFPPNPSPTKIIINGSDLNFTVYRTADCGCCAEYIKYLRATSNLNVIESIIQDLTPYRNVNVSSNGLESCHVGFSGSYFVEGHIPLEAIKFLLENRPNVVGIALPEMPYGSPGMGGIKSAPFQIYALYANGSSTLFITI